MLHQLLSFLKKEKFKTFVICLSKEGKIGKLIEGMGINVYYLDIESFFVSPFAFYKLIKYTKIISPDVIQGWMYHGNIAGIVAGKLKKIPVLWNIRHTPYFLKDEKISTRLLIRLGAFFSRYIQKIVYCSAVSADKHQLFGYPRAKTVVIPNGFDLEKYGPARNEARIALFEKTGISKEAFLIGHIARYHPMKDHLNFIEAAGILHRQHPDVRYIMIGRGVNRQNSILMGKIDQLGLNDCFYLMGESDSLHLILPAFDLVVSSSAWGESFPLAIGEAMSCGVPCVVTDIGGSAELVGNTGKVVPPKNSQALADAWTSMKDLKPKERKKMGKSARERIAEHFTLESIVLKYEELYNTIENNNTK